MPINFLEKNPLYKECLEVLNTKMVSDQEADEITEQFKKTFPITNWGKIDWNKINKKIYIGYDPEQIIPVLSELFNEPIEKNIYIEWSDGPQPPIKANLDKVIEYFDYVTCISFDKFIFNPVQGYIIEVLFGNKITVGVIPVNISKT